MFVVYLIVSACVQAHPTIRSKSNVAYVTDVIPVQREKPPRVTQAVALLWIAYVLSMVHVALALGYISRMMGLGGFVPAQAASFLLYALLIYSISKGRNWARLTYLVLMGVRVVNVGWMLPRDHQTSMLSVTVTAISPYRATSS